MESKEVVKVRKTVERLKKRLAVIDNGKKKFHSYQGMLNARRRLVEELNAEQSILNHLTAK